MRYVSPMENQWIESHSTGVCLCLLDNRSKSARNFFLSLSLSKINFLRPGFRTGARRLSTLFCRYGAWIFETWIKKQSLQTVQAEFRLLKQVTVCHGTMSKYRLIRVGSVFLNCLLKIIFEGRLEMHNLLMSQISEWSLLPICGAPECENVPGLLVMNKSIVVVVPAVIRVGLWINWWN